ncbi:hypothetical protein B0H14DRAFT_2601094 [Mycena olivaceomarginata]|nr:hypothetical protein B0H14DRAFT_2601094 [Mycena olivaceomarginata]
MARAIKLLTELKAAIDNIPNGIAAGRCNSLLVKNHLIPKSRGLPKLRRRNRDPLTRTRPYLLSVKTKPDRIQASAPPASEDDSGDDTPAWHSAKLCWALPQRQAIDQQERRVDLEF